MTRKRQLKEYARTLEQQTGVKFRRALGFVTSNLTIAYGNTGTWDPNAITTELVRLHKLEDA